MPADQSPKARCPFCRKSVNEDILRFGGNCPHCLIEIPGEEAPTDPGAELRAAQKAAELRERRRRRLVRGALATAATVIAGVGFAAWYLLRPPPPPELAYRFEFEILPLEMHQDLDYPELMPEQEPEAAPAPSHHASTTSHPSASTSGISTTTAPRATPAPEATVASASSPTIADSPLEAFAVPVTLGDRGPKAMVLSDPEQISEMIGRVLARGQAQITRCYETRLNAKPDLAGTWLVDFTVDTNRKATDVAVQALDRPDRELEKCIARTVERWEFVAVKDPVPSGTKYRFSPRG